MTLAEAILATTPQQVYDKLITMDPNLSIWMDQPCQCALHLFFTDMYPDLEDIVIHVEEIRLQDPRARGYQTVWLRLPPWMYGFQIELMELYPNEVRLQQILDYLVNDFHVEE